MRTFAFKSWHPPWQFRDAHARARLRLARCVCLLLESLEQRCVPSALAATTNSQTASPAAVRNADGLLGFADNLAGWNQSPGDTGLISLVTSWTAAGGVDPATGATVASRLYEPEDGAEHFAVLKTAGPHSITLLSQVFTVDAPEHLSFAAFFDAGDHAPFNDYGDVVLYRNGQPLVTLFAANILGGDGSDSKPTAPLLAPRADGGESRDAVGSYGNTPWTQVQYAITEPGNYALEARTSNTTDDALDSYLGIGDVRFIEPKLVIDTGAPITTQTGDVVARRVTFTDNVLDTLSVEIDPGTGVFTPFDGAIFSSPTPGGADYFDYSAVFTKPGTYEVVFRVHDRFASAIDVYQDARMLVNVFPPPQFAQLDQTAALAVPDGQDGAVVDVGGKETSGADMHMWASIDNATPGAAVFAGTYKNDPVDRSATIGSVIKVGGDSATVPTAFFDVRSSGVTASSVVTVRFRIEVDPGQDIDAIKLYFHDGAHWTPIVADPSSPIKRSIIGIDPATGKEIVEIVFTATKNTTPSILDLHGTVFTVALPAPPPEPTPTPVAVPVAALNAPLLTTTLNTTFSSDSGGTFVLRVSQSTEFSSSRTEASTAIITVAREREDDPAAAVRAALNIDWLLRMLRQQSEANPPALPGAGAPQNAPMAPAEKSPEPAARPADSEAVDAAFARYVADETEAEVELLEPDLFEAPLAECNVPDNSEGALRARAEPAWAMVTSAIGLWQLGPIREARKNQRGAEKVSFMSA